VHDGRLEERLDVTFGRAGVPREVQHGGRIGNRERGARVAEDVEHALADVGDERVDVDERLHLATACARVGDHDTAVGVTDEHDRTRGALREERRDVRAVGRNAAEQVRRGQNREPLTLERDGHCVPARSVCPGTVDENDSWLGHGTPPASDGAPQFAVNHGVADDRVNSW
jgi:hypothetical protein